MTEPKPSAKSALHPAINTLLASLRTGAPKIHNGLGLWPVFADCRPEPAYLTLVEALALPGFKLTIVHLALFGGGGLGKGHPAEPRILCRRSSRVE